MSEVLEGSDLVWQGSSEGVVAEFKRGKRRSVEEMGRDCFGEIVEGKRERSKGGECAKL